MVREIDGRGKEKAVEKSGERGQRTVRSWKLALDV